MGPGAVQESAGLRGAGIVSARVLRVYSSGRSFLLSDVPRPFSASSSRLISILRTATRRARASVVARCCSARRAIPTRCGCRGGAAHGGNAEGSGIAARARSRGDAAHGAALEPARGGAYDARGSRRRRTGVAQRFDLPGAASRLHAPRPLRAQCRQWNDSRRAFEAVLRDSRTTPTRCSNRHRRMEAGDAAGLPVDSSAASGERPTRSKRVSDWVRRISQSAVTPRPPTSCSAQSTRNGQR